MAGRSRLRSRLKSWAQWFLSFECDNFLFVRVSNKESRIQQLTTLVEELKKQVGKKISRTQIEPLKGRLSYAAGHTHGRCTQLACQLLDKFSGDGPLVKLSLESFIQW